MFKPLVSTVPLHVRFEEAPHLSRDFCITQVTWPQHFFQIHNSGALDCLLKNKYKVNYLFINSVERPSTPEIPNNIQPPASGIFPGT